VSKVVSRRLPPGARITDAQPDTQPDSTAEAAA